MNSSEREDRRAVGCVSRGTLASGSQKEGEPVKETQRSSGREGDN